ncbi:MAG: nucleotidyltransferase domain-containing protein [Nanoarchaeota archaeon]|nr:nucleotidyltransferase domain-containing protein [Nanoarchaeota archaeon]
MPTELIKQAFRLGNSAGVILPKEWENKKVRVQLIEKSITQDIFEILEEKNLLSDVIGIYLTGSYARDEETPKSDIDVLIITNNTDKLVKYKDYEITAISKQSFEKNIQKSPFLLSQIKESKTILNNDLIEKYKKLLPNFTLNKYLEEIKSVAKINEDSVYFSEEYNEKVLDGTAYSIILRLRELYLIDCLLKNKKCSKKEFLTLIKISENSEYYEAYLRVKNDKPSKDNLSVEEGKRLLSLTKKLIKDLKDGKKR